MEPGDLRESPAGSGESDTGDWREVIPGADKDEEVKAAETNGPTPATGNRDTSEESENEKQKNMGEQLHSPYEEELDPRIQVRAPASNGQLTSLKLADLINDQQLLLIFHVMCITLTFYNSSRPTSMFPTDVDGRETLDPWSCPLR